MLNLIALVLLSLAARPSAAQGRAAASAQNRPLAALRIDARAQAVRTQVRARVAAMIDGRTIVGHGLHIFIYNDLRALQLTLTHMLTHPKRKTKSGGRR